MSVTLSPLAPRYAVSDADDPFKKYWWAILMGIVFTALWLLTPMLGEKSVGSTAIDTSKPKADANVEQSFASEDAGNGIDLSMDGAIRKKKEESLLGSSLYQAPPEETAAAPTAGSAALGSASGATLAGALKKVSESAGGGWGEKAQKGFTAPKLAGGSLSGMGAAGGGRSGSASGTSAFGSSNANIGFAGTKGLSGGGSDVEAEPQSKGMTALHAASAQSLLAAASRSNDDARSSLSKAFDGAKGGSKIGANVATLPGNYAALDAAPVNLKLDDPKLNEKKIVPPAGVDSGGDNGMQDSELGKQIAMQLAGAALGAMIGGPVGGIVTNAIMQAIERQEAQQRKVRELEEKKQLNEAARRRGLNPTSSQ